MTDALARIRERLEQHREARRVELNARLDAALERLARERGAHRPGDRVFDTVTGQEGEVVARTTENIIVPVAQR